MDGVATQDGREYAPVAVYRIPRSTLNYWANKHWINRYYKNWLLHYALDEVQAHQDQRQ